MRGRKVSSELPDDPIFPAMEAFRSANARLERHRINNIGRDLTDKAEREWDVLSDARMIALEEVYSVTVSTVAGLLALVDLFMEEELPAMAGMEFDAAQSICQTVKALCLQSSA